LTLKSHKPHFNVKFLKGYGHSISVNPSKIILKNNYNPFSKPETESWFVKDMPYDRIVLQGKGYISTEGLSLLSENNKTVILLDTFGNQITICHGIRDSYTATKYRIAQYDTFRDKTKTDYLSRQITRGKLESQMKFLKSQIILKSHRELKNYLVKGLVRQSVPDTTLITIQN